jgi:hypothetical protein
MSAKRRVWGLKWASDNRLDGRQEHIINYWRGEQACIPALFVTRREARAYVEKEYGYIRRRADLQSEPHGWRVPQVVRLEVCKRA